MSIDTHCTPVSRLRCEAVTLDINHLSPCVHTKLANATELQFDHCNATLAHAADPALLIGLALSFVRQGPLLDCNLAEPLMVRLRAFADGGNPACSLLLDWLQNRNRHFGDASIADAPVAAQTAVAINETGRRPRRSPSERIMAAAASPASTGGIRRIRTRPRDPVCGPEAETIATGLGGRADG